MTITRRNEFFGMSIYPTLVQYDFANENVSKAI
jgi:hypothetical protein